MLNRNYKLILAMFAMTSTLVFTGCKKDDEPTPISKEQVVGVWNLASSEQKFSGTSLLGEIKGDGESADFKADGTVVAKDYASDTSPEMGTWQLNGNKITITFTEDSDDFFNATFIPSGTYEIQKVSGVELNLYEKKSQSMSGVTFSTENIVKFKK